MRSHAAVLVTSVAGEGQRQFRRLALASTTERNTTMREVRSPITSDPSNLGPRWGTSPGAFSSPSNEFRTDSHRGPHAGGKGWTPKALRRKADDGDLGFDRSGPTPVAGGYHSPDDPRE